MTIQTIKQVVEARLSLLAADLEPHTAITLDAAKVQFGEHLATKLGLVKDSLGHLIVAGGLAYLLESPGEAVKTLTLTRALTAALMANKTKLNTVLMEIEDDYLTHLGNNKEAS